jgi:hypothetical protein
MNPSYRKPFGVLAIIFGLAAYVVLVVGLSDPIGELHVLLQAPIYLVLGVAWVLPLKPLVLWMETGRWRRP